MTRVVRIATLSSEGGRHGSQIRQSRTARKRVIDLLPAFLELSAQVSKKVYVRRG